MGADRQFWANQAMKDAEHSQLCTCGSLRTDDPQSQRRERPLSTDLAIANSGNVGRLLLLAGLVIHLPDALQISVSRENGPLAPRPHRRRISLIRFRDSHLSRAGREP